MITRPGERRDDRSARRVRGLDPDQLRPLSRAAVLPRLCRRPGRAGSGDRRGAGAGGGVRHRHRHRAPRPARAGPGLARGHRSQRGHAGQRAATAGAAPGRRMAPGRRHPPAVRGRELRRRRLPVRADVLSRQGGRGRGGLPRPALRRAVPVQRLGRHRAQSRRPHHPRDSGVVLSGRSAGLLPRAVQPARPGGRDAPPGAGPVHRHRLGARGEDGHQPLGRRDGHGSHRGQSDLRRHHAAPSGRAGRDRGRPRRQGRRRARQLPGPLPAARTGLPRPAALGPVATGRRLSRCPSDRSRSR